MDQLGPIVLVGCVHSHRQEYDGSAGIRPGSLGGVQSLCHQVVELHSLTRLEFLAILVDCEEVLGRGTCLCASPFWLCFVDR